MTPQEQQLIDGLINRIRSTPATDKDDEADRYLHQNLDPVPDVLYVLAQTVLVQQYGLQNAQQQLSAAQQQVDSLQQQLDQARSTAAQQPQRSGSFLGHLFGTDAPQQQPQQGYQPVNTGYPAPPPPAYGQPGYPSPGYGPGYGQPVLVQQPGYVQQPGFGMGGGGFLRGALQTAAGVAAGEMVFQGMEDMFRGFGHEGGGYGGRPTEVINNNYYDNDRPESHEHREAGSDDSSFYNAANDASRQDLSPDIEDRRGLADSANDATDNTSGDSSSEGFFDSGANDTGSNDDSGYDDNSGSDNSDGYDDSSN